MFDVISRFSRNVRMIDVNKPYGSLIPDTDSDLSLRCLCQRQEPFGNNHQEFHQFYWLTKSIFSSWIDDTFYVGE
jgi:hypothetical protein